MDVDPLLRDRIAKALGIGGEDSDDDSNEEELMDDDQMLAIDAQLAAVFKARVGEKKGEDPYSDAGPEISYRKHSRCSPSARDNSLQEQSP
jgi:hypothetical protein